LAFIANAQDFKVIEETKDYILKECDSVYFWNNGLEPKFEFDNGSLNIEKREHIYKLPLDNGKLYILKDKGYSEKYWEYSKPGSRKHEKRYIYYGLNKSTNKYLVSESTYPFVHKWYLISKGNGKSEKLKDEPRYSPSHLFYAYGYNCINNNNSSEIYFKCIKSNKVCKIKIHREYQENLEWINDYSFMFSEFLFDKIKDIRYSGKYYIVQIKQIKQ
jgi:hypothetical protein